MKTYGPKDDLSDVQPGDIIQFSPTGHKQAIDRETTARIGNIKGLLTVLRNNSTVQKNGMTALKLQSGDAELVYYYLGMYKELLEDKEEKIINDGKICKTCAYYDNQYYICSRINEDTGQEQWCKDWIDKD